METGGVSRSENPPPSLAEALVTYSSAIEAFVARGAGRLVHREAVEDLAQGVCLRMLERADSFEWRSELEFLSWTKVVVGSYLNTRRQYWNAARRNAGHVLRVSLGGRSDRSHAGVDPASLRTGPATFAARRDQMHVATQAMSMLLDRDQRIIEHERNGLSITEIGQELGLTTEAAGRARLRAHGRFHRAFELLLRADYDG